MSIPGKAARDFVSNIVILRQLQVDRANPQLIHLVVQALYADCPRNLKVPNPTKHRPSTRLDNATRRGIASERILLGLAGDNSAVRACPDNAVENQDRHSVLLSLDYIPGLPNCAYRVAISGERNRKREPGLGENPEPPKARSARTDVPETPSGSQSAHRSCAKHVEAADHAKEQRQQGKRWKEFEQ